MKGSGNKETNPLGAPNARRWATPCARCVIGNYLHTEKGETLGDGVLKGNTLAKHPVLGGKSHVR